MPVEIDHDLAIRLSSIVVVFAGGLAGCWLPVYASRNHTTEAFKSLWLLAKHFASGVIVATAFIHLLAPAHEALDNDEVIAIIGDYSWVEAICLASLFVLFVVELVISRSLKRRTLRNTVKEPGHEQECRRDWSSSRAIEPSTNTQSETEPLLRLHRGGEDAQHASGALSRNYEAAESRGGDALLLHREEPQSIKANGDSRAPCDSYASQITSMLILEFGIVFHSIFIGLTLAVAGDEFLTLYVVLTIHQTFEGVAIGVRLASVNWQGRNSLTPYYMSAGYALSTPLAIGVGLALRNSLSTHTTMSLLVNGVFDAVSAGILIYTGLVELMAQEFIMNAAMQTAPAREVWSAIGSMSLGAMMMAILGIWA